MRRAARRVSQIYEAELDAYGLGVAQYGLLQAVRGADEGKGVTIGALAAGMGLDSTTLSRNLRHLERRGLVALTIDRADRRSRLLRLTPAGRALLKAAAAGWRAAQGDIFARLGTGEAEALLTILDEAMAKLPADRDMRTRAQI